MTLKNNIRSFNELLDREWLKKHILNLYHLERPQKYPAFEQAAKYVYDLLREEGLEAEWIDVPADGMTTYHDKRIPIGWDVNKMKLTLLSEVPGLEDPVISDYEREPLMAVRHSVSTPPEGIVARLVTENQMKTGEDVRGAFVLLEQSTHPSGKIIEMLLDLGAYGWVSDYCENPCDAPDHTAWASWQAESFAWHVQLEDRDFISYLVTPRTGYYLRRACENGWVTVRAESDGRRYVANLPIVSGLLRGESEKEVWMLAHMYEPLIDDNSNGVIGSIAILKALRDMMQRGEIHLKYSVRLVCASEIYGFAAAAEHYGGELSKRAIGAINMDGIPGSKEKGRYRSLRVREAPDQPGFAGNVLLHAVCREFQAVYPEAELILQPHGFGDDRCLSDATVGLPTVWFLRGEYDCFHHNAILDESYLDVEVCAFALSACGAWVRAMAALTEQELCTLLPKALENAQELLDRATHDVVREGTDTAARMAFLYQREYQRIASLSLWGAVPQIKEALIQLKVPEAANTYQSEPPQKERPFYATANSRSWYDYAEDFVFTRVGRGLPHDQVRILKRERRKIPGFMLYDNLADIFSRMDGVKTLRTLITEMEWDENIILEEATIRAYLYTCTRLADAGYLKMCVKNPLTAEEITDALKGLGISEGETVLVHSSLSGIGYIPGGADTVIDGFLGAVGEKGTMLAPAFSRPYIMFEGTMNRGLIFRPYDMRPDGELRDLAIATGVLPRTMLKRSDSLRSNHSTHEWVAIGHDAAECVKGHGFFDPPAGVTSPLGKALKRGGSVVFFGYSIASNTFIHYLEEVATDLPKPGVIKYIDMQGELRTGFLAHQYPEDRDFYHVLDSKFYQEAVKRGLRIHTQPLGIGTIYRMELQNLYEVGMEMIRENPNVTLVNNGE